MTPFDQEAESAAFLVALAADKSPLGDGRVIKIIDLFLTHKLLPALLPHLEELIDERVERATPGYLGTWQAQTVYLKNSWVTYNGHIWIARADTTAEPDGGVFWQMAMRQPKAAR